MKFWLIRPFKQLLHYFLVSRSIVFHFFKKPNIYLSIRQKKKKSKGALTPVSHSLPKCPGSQKQKHTPGFPGQGQGPRYWADTHHLPGFVLVKAAIRSWELRFKLRHRDPGCRCPLLGLHSRVQSPVSFFCIHKQQSDMQSRWIKQHHNCIMSPF